MEASLGSQPFSPHCVGRVTYLTQTNVLSFLLRKQGHSRSLIHPMNVEHLLFTVKTVKEEIDTMVVPRKLVQPHS